MRKHTTGQKSVVNVRFENKIIPGYPLPEINTILKEVCYKTPYHFDHARLAAILAAAFRYHGIEPYTRVPLTWLFNKLHPIHSYYVCAQVDRRSIELQVGVVHYDNTWYPYGEPEPDYHVLEETPKNFKVKINTLAGARYWISQLFPNPENNAA